MGVGDVNETISSIFGGPKSRRKLLVVSISWPVARFSLVEILRCAQNDSPQGCFGRDGRLFASEAGFRNFPEQEHPLMCTEGKNSGLRIFCADKQHLIK